MPRHLDGFDLQVKGAHKLRTHGDSSFELVVPNFRVQAGELIAVLGPSGCGKSTLLDLLALVMAPTAVDQFRLQVGSHQHDLKYLWDHEDEAGLAALRRDYLGYVLQAGGLLPFLTVRDNALLPGRIKGLQEQKQRIEWLAERLGLQECLSRMPTALSIGQRQRVAILRALAHGPRLILADEPTASVDKARARSIMDDLQALARDETVAVVVVTHDVDLVSQRADKTYHFTVEQLNERQTRAYCRLQGGEHETG